jgi:hypothetical protein
MQLVVMAIDALGHVLGGGRKLLGMKADGEEREGQKPAAAPQESAPAHWTSWVQLVPPVGSYLMVPNWSLQ